MRGLSSIPRESCMVPVWGPVRLRAFCKEHFNAKTRNHPGDAHRWCRRLVRELGCHPDHRRFPEGGPPRDRSQIPGQGLGHRTAHGPTTAAGRSGLVVERRVRGHRAARGRTAAGGPALRPVAEDAVQVILKLEAELEAERSMSRLVQLRDRTRSRDIVGSLLEYVMRFAALNWERPTGECWSAIQAARIFLQKTTEQVPDRGEESKPEPASSGGDERASVLAALRAQGLTIGECIQALAVPDDDPYVKAARRSILGGDDLEIDDRTATAPGERGAWVLGWFWISDEQAGVLSNSAMLEALLDYARGALAGAHGLDAETARLRRNQADWLEDLLSNLADEVDAIALARPTSAPGAILWVDRQGRDVLFAPSDALLALLDLARQAGLEERVAGQCERFCAQYGSTLDRMLTVVQIG